MTGETLVASAEGLIRIGSLHHGEAEDTFREERLVISSLDGDRKSDAFYYGGSRPVRRVTLRSGHSITGTYPTACSLRAPANSSGRPSARSRRATTSRCSTVPTLVRHPGQPSRHHGVRAHGNEKPVSLPERDDRELAFLLGAYAAEGHTTRSNWTISITNSVPEVLERVQPGWQVLFGLRARLVADPGKCAR